VSISFLIVATFFILNLIDYLIGFNLYRFRRVNVEKMLENNLIHGWIRH
jgi:hypothetical protein